MNEPFRYESIQEPLDDEERELMDPNTWDWASTEEGIPTPAGESCDAKGDHAER